MGKLMSMSPAVLLVLTACGSRGTHDDDDPVIVTPDPACEIDEDCGDGAICFDGTCALIAATESPDTTPPETAPSATTTSTSTTGPTTSLPDPDDVPSSSLSGVWIGYLEASNFPSGSDLVRLEIHADDCTPTASLTLGEGEPLPPLTDPDVAYPYDTFRIFPSLQWYEGHSYAATNIELSDLRVQLVISYGQVWTEWCALQEPVLTDHGHYSCVEATSWSFDGDVCTMHTAEGDIPHDCGHLELCVSGTCGCDESECRANPGGGATLDVALDDGHLEGSLAGFGPVRFYREE